MIKGHIHSTRRVRFIVAVVTDMKIDHLIDHIVIPVQHWEFDNIGTSVILFTSADGDDALGRRFVHCVHPHCVCMCCFVFLGRANYRSERITTYASSGGDSGCIDIPMVLCDTCSMSRSMMMMGQTSRIEGISLWAGNSEYVLQQRETHAFCTLSSFRIVIETD